MIGDYCDPAEQKSHNAEDHQLASDDSKKGLAVTFGVPTGATCADLNCVSAETTHN